MQQALDFVAESTGLFHVVRDLGDKAWDQPTQFKGWTLNDVFVHLHFWNGMADLSLQDPAGFAAQMAELFPQMQAQGMRAVENAQIPLRGAALRAAWWDLCQDMGPRWAALDPKQRVAWVGPEMSVRSSITARQMETWAHGQEVFDLLGATRDDADRIRNVVVLGVNTFGWTYKVRGQTPPGEMPQLRLTAPSGAVWDYGAPGSDLITGAAVEFAQVVAQTRNIADTKLQVQGDVARDWMSKAQCFAGGPETPPAPGTRFRQEGAA